MKNYIVQAGAFLLGISILLGAVGPVSADAAPPENPPGSDLSPQQTTAVRMFAERVVFDMTTLVAMNNGYINVTASFSMINSGDTPEAMMARFPVGCIDNFGDAPLIDYLTVEVNDSPVDVQYQQGEPIILPLPPLYRGPVYHCETMPWATFPVTFPANQETILDIQYRLSPTWISDAAGTFGYILETGSGWAGTIGKATFVVRLPYTATADNISGVWGGGSPFDPEYAQNEVQWEVEDFEPTSKHNLVFRFIYPDYWQKVIDAASALEKKPDDSELLVQLGNAYEDVAWEFHGDVNPHFLNLSLEAYNQALLMNPYSANAHTGIARVQWHEQGVVLFPLDPEADFLQPILEHLSVALALEPENSQARQLWEEISEVANHKAQLPTVNPTLLPTSTSTPTLTTTATPKPSATATLTKIAGPTIALSNTPMSEPTPVVELETTTSSIYLPLTVILILTTSIALTAIWRKRRSR